MHKFANTRSPKGLRDSVAKASQHLPTCRAHHSGVWAGGLLLYVNAILKLFEHKSRSFKPSSKKWEFCSCVDRSGLTECVYRPIIFCRKHTETFSELHFSFFRNSYSNGGVRQGEAPNVRQGISATNLAYLL